MTVESHMGERVIRRYCTKHGEFESADGIGYCWLAAVPYTEPETCEFEFRYIGRYFDEEIPMIEKMWNERHDRNQPDTTRA